MQNRYPLFVLFRIELFVRKHLNTIRTIAESQSEKPEEETTTKFDESTRQTNDNGDTTSAIKGCQIV